MDISTIKITWKKVRGIHVDISTIEITSKKYMESTWKFVEIWSSTYRRNIYVECTSIRRGVPVGRALHALMSHGPYSLRALVSHMFRAVRVSYPSCFCASFVLFLLFIVSFCKCLMCLVLYVCYHTCSPALWPYVSYMHLVTCTLHDSSVISTFMDLCVHVARCFKFKFISYLWAFLRNLLRLTWT